MGTKETTVGRQGVRGVNPDGMPPARQPGGFIPGLLGSLALLVALASLPDTTQAQTGELRAGWGPFQGCWQSADEAEGILCLVASGQDVEMLTIVEGSVAFREPFAADGLTREIERDGCQGTESARFSEDRLRLYTASDVACAGEAPRRSTGIITMTGPSDWLDVRAIEVNGATTAWSQHYRRTSSRVLADLGLMDAIGPVDPFALRGIGHAPDLVTVDHVIDASRNVKSEAVEGWLVETGREFADLDAGDLKKAMLGDTKHAQGRIRLILPRGLGDAHLTGDFSMDALDIVLSGRSP